MSEAFRTAPQVTTMAPDVSKPSVNEIAVRSDVNAEVPFSQYEALHGVPYTAKYFGIDNYEVLNDLLDIGGIRGKVGIIEGYILNQIEKNDFEDSVETYENIINEFFANLGINKNETTDSKFEKMAKYIKMLGKSRAPQEMSKDLVKRQEAIKDEYSKREIEIKSSIEKTTQEKKEIMKELSSYKAKLAQLEKNLANEKENNYSRIMQYERERQVLSQREQHYKNLLNTLLNK